MSARTFDSRTTSPPQAVSPRFRGVTHLGAFLATVPLGVVLVLHARSGVAQVGAAVFAASVTFMLGSGSLFHRRRWTAERMRWIGLLDHASIYVLIAGTYTPVRAARASARLAAADPRCRLGRCARGDLEKAVPAARASVGRCRHLCRPRLGLRARHTADPASASGPVRRRCSQPAASPTPSAPSSTCDGGPIPSPRSSATTRSSTLW